MPILCAQRRGAQYWHCEAKYLPNAAASSTYRPYRSMSGRHNEKPQLLYLGKSSDHGGYEHTAGLLFVIVGGWLM